MLYELKYEAIDLSITIEKSAQKLLRKNRAIINADSRREAKAKIKSLYGDEFMIVYKKVKKVF